MTPEEFAAFLEGPAEAVPPGSAAERLRRGLDAPGIWDEPPDGLLDSILADIEQEGGAGQRELPEPVVPAPVASLGSARGRSRLVRWGSGLAAAAAIALITVLAMRPEAGTEISLAATPKALGASATAIVRDTDTGLAITLAVRELAPAPPGTFYQAWMKGQRGSVTIGTFHNRGGQGDVELWSGVALADYPVLTVTLEPEDGDPASSGEVVLTSGP